MNYSFNYRPETIPPLNKIYTYKTADHYKAKFYNKLTDIVGGNISYNINERNIEEIYSSPIFTNKSQIIAKRYIDPMDSFKPEYERIQKENNNVGQLTWIQDSCEWREDLIARQMRKLNQSEYDPKWRIY